MELLNEHNREILPTKAAFDGDLLIRYKSGKRYQVDLLGGGCVLRSGDVRYEKRTGCEDLNKYITAARAIAETQPDRDVD